MFCVRMLFKENKMCVYIMTDLYPVLAAILPCLNSLNLFKNCCKKQADLTIPAFFNQRTHQEEINKLYKMSSKGVQDCETVVVWSTVAVIFQLL